jgi:excisionase family DNA binding protein
MGIKSEEGTLTMQEAMHYLKINSRSTFYRLLTQGKISYVNLNPTGDYEIRRFKKSMLDKYLNGTSEGGE